MIPAMTASSEIFGSVSPQGTRRMRRIRRLAALAGACLALASCSSIKSVTDTVGSFAKVGNFITPYKVEVVQGNFVSKEQKDALQVGMPRAQVRDILGSPLVTSAFHADRWEYVFTIRRQGQESQQRKLTVFFKGDELSKVDGDELISEQEFVTALSVGRSLGKVPLLEVPPEVLREFGIKNSASNTAVAVANNAPSASTNTAPTSYPPLEAPGAITSAWDASTQRAVAASNAARPSTSSAAANAPLLTAQAPAPTVAPTPATVAPAAAPTLVPAPAPARVVAAPAPSAASSGVVPASQSPVPAPAPAPTTAVAVVAAALPATTSAPVVAAVASSSATAPQASPATPQAAPTPVPPPVPIQSASTLAAADPDITSFLNRWTSDWQARNASAYFGHYLPEFKGTSPTRAEWETLRRTRIEGRSRISLGVFDVRVRMVSPTEARLVFRQDYESDAYREVGTKAMFLVKRDGRWFIEREFFTPAAQ